jgi:hypothetical protein
MTSLKEKIIGTWKLISWTYKNDQGVDVDYFGKNSMGILIYDASGYMNVQIMKGDRQKFSSESINGATAEEALDAFNSYLAYFGKYVEEKPGEMVHTVEGSLFPNWLGKKEVRYGRIEGDLLVLSTPPIQAGGVPTVFYITWKRMTF